MPVLLMCPKGHQFEALSGMDAGANYCPECGTLIPFSSDSGRTVARSPDTPLPEQIATMDGTPPEASARASVIEVTDLQRHVPGYEIIEEIGRGGMGVVYRALHVSLKRPVALKMVLAGAHAGEKELERFRTEAEAIAQLQHPNFVQIYEVGIAGETPYLSLEYIDGGSLEHCLEGLLHCPLESARLVETLARAMHYAHVRGIVHRDLKPANVLLKKNLSPESAEKLEKAMEEGGACALTHGLPAESLFIPKITDFGLAKRMDSALGQTASGAIVGTPSYMSPEQAQGQTHDVGPSTDIYALGVMLYELLVGRPPFRGQTPMETVWQVMTLDPVPPSRLQPKVPCDLETICLKCLHREPSRRYATALELADDLHRYLHGEPIWARPIGVVERFWLWKRRNPQLAIALIIATFAMFSGTALAAGFGIWQMHTADELATTARELSVNREHIQGDLERSIQAEAQLAMERGLSLCAREDAARGLLWLTHSLEKASQLKRPGGAEQNLEQVLRGNLADWARRLHPLQAVLDHHGQVYMAAISPDGKWLATGSRYDGASLWRWDIGLGLRSDFPFDHSEAVRALAFSPDSKLLVTGSDDRTVRIWDLDRKMSNGPPLNAGGPVDSVEFSKDGRKLLTVSRRGGVHAWDPRAASRLATLTHPEDVLCAVLSPDGQSVLTGSTDNKARLWDLKNPESPRQVVSHRGDVLTSAFSPDGTLAATGGEDGDVMIWHCATGELAQPMMTLQSSVNKLLFSPNGKLLLSASDDNRARLWRVGSEQTPGLEAVMPHLGTVRALAFSPDGNLVLTGSHDNTARVWDLTGKPILSPLHHQGTVHAVAFHPNGKMLLSASADESVRLWQLNTEPRPLEILPHQGPVHSVAFRPDSKVVLSAGQSREVYLWERATMEVCDLENVNAIALAATYSPDGDRVLLGLADHRACVYDADSRKSLFVLTGHKAPVTAVAYSPRGDRMATASQDGQVRQWDARTGKALGEPMAHPDSVHALVYDSQSELLITGAEDGAVRLWSVTDQVEVREPLWHQGAVHSVAVSPDGRLILSGSSDSTARLWDRHATGKQISRPMQHFGDVHAVAFAPDGQTVITGSDDNTARFWDVATQRPLGFPLTHDGTVWAVAYAPDGKSVLTGSSDRHARIWPVPQRKEDSLKEIQSWVTKLTGLSLVEAEQIEVLSREKWKDAVWPPKTSMRIRERR